MSIQTRTTLLGYNNCVETHPKHLNHLESFFHQLDGRIIKSFQVENNKITLVLMGKNSPDETLIIPIGGGIGVSNQFTEDQATELLQLIYNNGSQSISVSPISFEKGSATDLVYTWNVIRRDDGITSVILDGSEVTAQANGSAKTYNVNGVTSTKSLSLQTVLDRNGSIVNLNNTATSTGLLYGFWGIFNQSNSPTGSPFIRVLNKQFLNTANKGIITTNVQSGSGLKEISFYVKKGNNYRVTDLGNLGLIITDDFTNTDVNVENGGGGIEQYEKVTKTLGADFGLVNFRFEII